MYVLLLVCSLTCRYMFWGAGRGGGAGIRGGGVGIRGGGVGIGGWGVGIRVGEQV